MPYRKISHEKLHSDFEKKNISNQGTLIAGPDGEDLVEYGDTTKVFGEFFTSNVCCEPNRFSDSRSRRNAYYGNEHPAQRKRQAAFSTPFEDDDIYGMNMGLRDDAAVQEKENGAGGAFDLSKVRFSHAHCVCVCVFVCVMHACMCAFVRG
jgi:hypothetical protein